MDTAQAPKEQSPQRRRNLGIYLCKQQDLQKSMRCDYVLLWYKRDPKTAVGQCPKFLTDGNPIPVSLSHNVFMQMAFGVLKDRLLSPSAQQQKPPKTAGDGEKSHTTTEPGAAGAEGKSVHTKREKDVVAMFCFLWQYVVSMLRAQEEAITNFKARKKGAQPQPTVRMTKQQLRLQLVLEYNVDVQRVLGDGLPTDGAVSKKYYRSLMTGNVSEEEFLNQLAKPAGMAQTCSLM